MTDYTWLTVRLRATGDIYYKSGHATEALGCHESADAIEALSVTVAKQQRVIDNLTAGMSGKPLAADDQMVAARGECYCIGRPTADDLDEFGISRDATVMRILLVDPGQLKLSIGFGALVDVIPAAALKEQT